MPIVFGMMLWKLVLEWRFSCWLLIDVSIGFGLMLCKLVFNWFIYFRKISQFIFEVCSCTLYWTGFFFQSLNSPSCHSARRACPKLQNPLSHLAKDKLLTGEKMPVWADERWRESTLPRHSSTVCNGHPNFRRARVNYSNMDSESSPSVPRRMTG